MIIPGSSINVAMGGWGGVITAAIDNAVVGSPRSQAERKCEPILEWTEREQALLFHILTKAGWNRDRCRTVLIKENWWL